MQEDQEQKRNVMLFFAISLVIMLGYPYVFKSQTPNQIASLDQNTVTISQVSEDSVRHSPKEASIFTQQTETKKTLKTPFMILFFFISLV